MTYIGISELQSYDGWIGKSALQIKQAVRRLPHGWTTVFQIGSTVVRNGINPYPIKARIVPQWASLTRNYFNETPGELFRLGEREAEREVNKLPKPGIIAKFGISKEIGEVLTPYQRQYAETIKEDRGYMVYKDRSGNTWFLMPPGAGIYHVGDGHPGSAEKYWAQVSKTHAEMPFKLVSPDGTGGSSELIIKNPKRLNALGEAGKWLNIHRYIDWNPVTRGSYNYAETLIEGFGRHNLGDVDPHEEMKKGAKYVNPAPFSPLAARIFYRGLI